MGAGLSRDRMSGVEASAEGASGCGLLCSIWQDLKAGKTKAVSGTVCVIGGGDSAMDAVRAQPGGRAPKRPCWLTVVPAAKCPPVTKSSLPCGRKGVELMYMVSPVKTLPKRGRRRSSYVCAQPSGLPGRSRAQGRLRFEAMPGSEFSLKASHVWPLAKRRTWRLLVGKRRPRTPLRVDGHQLFCRRRLVEWRRYCCAGGAARANACCGHGSHLMNY